MGDEHGSSIRETNSETGTAGRSDMRGAAAAGALVVALIVAGCGGPIKNDELERATLTLSSLAADGHLTTEGVIADRTKTTFVRVHARDIGEDATHQAEKLQDAEAKPRLVGAKRDAVEIAQAIADVAGDLQVAPSDVVVARDVRRRFDVLQHRADNLARRL